MLDTRSGPSGVSSIGVLLSSAPIALSRHFAADPKSKAALRRLERSQGVLEEAAQLRAKLTTPDIGYAATRHALARWMRQAMGDIGAAKADLGSHADLLAAGTTACVRRLGVEAHLDAVLREPERARCLLGGEKVGKTWAVLAWWLAKAGEDGSGLPLTVWLTAASAGRSSLAETIAHVLHQRTGIRTQEFWARRVGRWRFGETASLLIVVDGLNQNWLVRNWSELLQPMFAREWKSKVSVLLTCRPDHWLHALSGLQDLAPQPASQELNGFADSELGEMLVRHGRTRDQFPAKLLELIRVPRLFSLGIRRGGELEDVAELTPEALVLEDWKDRVSLHGNRISLGHQEFRDVVARLGEQFKYALGKEQPGHVTRRELLEELGRESSYGGRELGGAVSELVDGRWLSQVGLHKFKLDPGLVPVAMGLSLLDALRGKPDRDAVGDTLADFLDPLRGADLGVATLRAATTAALVEADTFLTIRETLLLAWLTSQNFFGTDFEAFWRLVGLQPELFLNVAQAGWLAERFSPHPTEVLCKAFANASKWEAVGVAVDRQSLLWLSALWFEDTDEASPPEARMGVTRDDLAARLEQLRAEAVPTLPGLAALHVEDDGVGWQRLSGEAISILSYRPRARAWEALSAWLLAMVLMDGWQHVQRMACVLRLNEDDPAEGARAVLSLVEELASRGGQAGAAAATLLLRLVATPQAEDVARRHGLPLRRDLPASRHAPDTAATAASTVADFRSLAAAVGEPDQRLDEQQVTSLATLCRTAPIAELMEAAAASGGFLALAARWAPEEIAPMLRGAADSASEAPDDAVWLDQAIARSYTFAAYADADVRARLISAWRLRREHMRQTRFQLAPAGTRPLELLDLPVERQVAVLAANERLGASDEVGPVLEPIPATMLDGMSEHLSPDAPVGRLKFWLDVIAAAKRPDPPGAPEFLVELAYHPDQGVRSAAMKALYLATADDAAVAFAGRGWQWQDGMPTDEAAYGSLLLLRAKPALGKAVLDRAEPQVAVAAFQDDPDEADRLEALLMAECAFIRDRKSQKSSNRYWVRRDVLPTFVAARPEVAERLATSIMEMPGALSDALFLIFPIVGLCEGLLRHRPEFGFRLWRALVAQQGGGMTIRCGLELLPFRVPRNGHVDQARGEALRAARTDRELAEIADAASVEADDGWLRERVERDVTAPVAGDVARALTLAGFMRTGPAAGALWSGPLAGPPAEGWLAYVHSQAKQEYARQKNAMVWASRLVESRRPEEATAALLLLISCEDWRAGNFARRLLQNAFKRLHPYVARLWNQSLRDEQAQSSRFQDARKEKFCFIDLDRTVFPWA